MKTWRNAGIIFLVILFCVNLLPLNTHAQQKGAPVHVTNTSENPVPVIGSTTVSGSVNISGTPNVNVSNTVPITGNVGISGTPNVSVTNPVSLAGTQGDNTFQAITVHHGRTDTPIYSQCIRATIPQGSTSGFIDIGWPLGLTLEIGTFSITCDIPNDDMEMQIEFWQHDPPPGVMEFMFRPILTRNTFDRSSKYYTIFTTNLRFLHLRHWKILLNRTSQSAMSGEASCDVCLAGTRWNQ